MHIPTIDATNNEMSSWTERNFDVRKICVIRSSMIGITSSHTTTPISSPANILLDNTLLHSELYGGGYCNPLNSDSAITQYSKGCFSDKTTFPDNFGTLTDYSAIPTECDGHAITCSFFHLITIDIKTFNPARNEHQTEVGGSFYMQKNVA